MQYFLKVIVVLFLIIAITEVGKRNQTAGAILASLPITSLLAILWLKQENTDPSIIINLCQDIFWMVIPSLVFFLVFPAMLKQNFNFWLCMCFSIALTSGAYFFILRILKSFSS